MATRYEWDEEKNRTNLLKHGVDFETAKLIFDDPNLYSSIEQIVDGEERWLAIGSTGGIVIFAVAHTIRDSAENEVEVVRIISARKATPSERRRYGN